MSEKSISVASLNEISMTMIMKAGSCRDILSKMMMNIEKLKEVEIEQKLKEAKKEIVIAHQEQTKVIQSTLEDEDFTPNLLFTHAQDTVMTVYSEYHTACNMVHIYKSLKLEMKK
ncbi:PTS system, cellobiose-specific IIA component [Enterococcus sp. AZ135]|uniref:PTS lactose/cellobiose transporter subunit IIA n=1 Tax=unclassified Enterococcus TaxID=2608891 RepID=UPI003F27E3A8